MPAHAATHTSAHGSAGPFGLIDPAAIDILRQTATRATADAELLRLRASVLVLAAGELRWNSLAAALFHGELSDLLRTLGGTAGLLDSLAAAIDRHLAALGRP